MAPKFSLIQEAASLPLVGSSFISTLWTSWAINSSYNSPMWRAVTVHPTAHTDSLNYLAFSAGLCCPFKAPAHQLCGHRNTEGIAASIIKTCPLTPDTDNNQTLLWGRMMMTIRLRPGRTLQITAVRQGEIMTRVVTTRDANRLSDILAVHDFEDMQYKEYGIGIANHVLMH